MEQFETLLGLQTERFEIFQMMTRAAVIFLIALLLVKFSGIRIFGGQTAFDHLSVIMLGAIMGRAIVVLDQSVLGSVMAAFVIMIMHRILAWITFYSRSAGTVFKGRAKQLMKNGTMNKENLKQTHITEADILEALRQQMNTESLDNIQEIYIERSGKISFIQKEN